jgi:hypothetical protein
MNPHNTHLFTRNSIYAAEIILLAIILSCEKDPEPLTLNSVISGWASLYVKYTGEPTNIRVTATGPYGHKSINVDASGMFLIDGLGNGTYSLEYSLEGYGPIRQYNIQLFGNDTARVQGARLFKMPKGAMPSFVKAYSAICDRYGPPTTFVCIETSVADPLTYGLDIMIFMNTGSDVAWNRYEIFYPASDANFNDANVHTVYIDPAVLPFKSGTKVFLKGYSCNTLEYFYGYLDTYLGLRMFSTLEKSKSTTVLNFTMP